MSLYVIISLAVIALAFLLALATTEGFRVRRKEIEVKNEIEKAIKVKGVETKFSILRWSFFSGAGAGGLGAPIIHADSVKQFLEIIPQGEPVYCSFGFQKKEDGYDNERVMEKVYAAFLPQRAGIVVYKDIYKYSEAEESREFKVKSYNSEKITFVFNPWPRLIAIPLIVGAISFFISGIVSFICY